MSKLPLLLSLTLLLAACERAAPIASAPAAPKPLPSLPSKIAVVHLQSVIDQLHQNTPAQPWLEEPHRTADLYRRINQAIALYAADQHIDLVLFADEVALESTQSPQQLRDQVHQRQILYSQSTLDISAPIVQMVTRQYASPAQ